MGPPSAAKTAPADGAAKAGCFGPRPEPKETPVSIDDLLNSTAQERDGLGAGPARARHPDDTRSGPVRACCVDGVCCRDGRCCFCEGRLPRADECLAWWLTYLPGLSALRDVHSRGHCLRPCRLCGGLCACATATLGFYACPCVPGALCALRVKDTLMCRRAVWGPFCDDAASVERGGSQHDFSDFLSCLPAMCEDGVDRDEGWLPRTRWWEQGRGEPAPAAAPAGAEAGGRQRQRPPEGGGRGGGGGGPPPPGAQPGATAGDGGPSYFLAGTRREGLLRISGAATDEEAPGRHAPAGAGGGRGHSRGAVAAIDGPPVSRPPAVVTMSSGS